MAEIDEILVAKAPGEIRLALIAQGNPVEFIVDRGAAARGDVMLGRVVSVNRKLGAAFINIGEARPGFLPRAGDLSEGAAVAVRVTTPSRRDKGTELARAGKITIPPDAKPPLRLEGLSPLARALAEHPDISRVTVDTPSFLAEARAFFPSAEWRADAFALHGADDALEEALSPRVALPGGGTLIIEETAGATIIDIDGGGGAPASANMAALPVIAAQIRLRGMAGHILIDFIPGRGRKELSHLIAELRLLLAEDPTPTRVIGSTPLGMIELTRERRRPTLAEIMLENREARRSAETIGLEGLKALLRETISRPAAAFALFLSPNAVSALTRRPAALEEAERMLGRKPVLREKPGLELFEIVETRK